MVEKEEEYELLPHEELDHLRREVDKLKKNPLHGVQDANTLLTAINDLTKAITGLTDLFTGVNDDMLKEFKRTSMTEQFNKISSENEQIAQGILSLVQLVSPPKQAVPKSSSAQPVTGQSTNLNMQSQIQSGQSQQAPFDSSLQDTLANQSAMQQGAFPPQEQPANINSLPSLDLPPPPAEKKGLFRK